MGIATGGLIGDRHGWRRGAAVPDQSDQESLAALELTLDQSSPRWMIFHVVIPILYRY